MTKVNAFIGVKSLILVMLYCLFATTVNAQRLYDGSGRYIGRIDGIRIYDGSGRYIGRAEGLEKKEIVLFKYNYCSGAVYD